MVWMYISSLANNAPRFEKERIQAGAARKLKGISPEKVQIIGKTLSKGLKKWDIGEFEEMIIATLIMSSLN